MFIEIKVPDIGEDEVEITDIMVKVGDQVAAEQSLITVEGDKASMEVPAPIAGTVQEIRIKSGDKVKTGFLIMIFTVHAITLTNATSVLNTEVETLLTKKSVDTTTSNTHIDNQNRCTKNASYVHATPVVRRLAREFGINLEQIKGSGRKCRILREDVQAYVKKLAQHANTIPIATLESTKAWPKVDFGKFGEIEEIDVGHIQRVSGANLSRNWRMIPHVTHFDKIDITDLEVFRKKQNKDAAKHNLGIKLTPVVFIMKATAVALEKMPRFNSSLSENGQKLILKKYTNIGVAVDTLNGLVVPVFKDVNKKSITELSRELTAAIKKSHDGQLTIKDMQGCCFTISSLGALGTTHFTPIINAPEVAILGVSKCNIEPVWNGTEFMLRLIMPISLSFDHRVINGADGARFITIVNNMLSDIRCLVM